MELTPGYRELRPPDAVRGVVECLWVRVPDAAREVRVVPDGCTDLVWEQGVGTTVGGPDTTARLVERAAGELLIGMRIRPGAGGPVLGIPLDELRDLRVEVAEVDRAFALDGELPPEEVVERFVSVAAGRRGDLLVAEAARRLAAEQDVRVVARDIGLSERQLRRRFHAAVGYGPKMLARVLRFRRFVAAIDAGRDDLARLALDAGYVDQAHLTRETTRLAGLPPAAFARARAGHPARAR